VHGSLAIARIKKKILRNRLESPADYVRRYAGNTFVHSSPSRGEEFCSPRSHPDSGLF